MNDIFVIITFRDDQAPTKEKPSRPVGFFYDLETAHECLEKGHGDLVEAGYYTIAAIEKIPAGLYPLVETVYWYENAGSSWKPIKEAPDWYNEQTPCSVVFG